MTHKEENMSRSQNLRHNVINRSLMIWRGVISLPHFHRKVRGGNVQHQPHYSASYSQPLTRCGVLTQVGNDYVIARKPDHVTVSPVLPLQ